VSAIPKLALISDCVCRIVDDALGRSGFDQGLGSQAFQESPRSHAPAITLAMIPQIAAWGKTMIDGALGAAGTNAATVGFDKLGNTGILYKGLETLGGGATLAGIILGAVTVFIIERQLEKAAAFALAGSVLTFFGLIHAEGIGIGQSPLWR
jgi:AGZA family xanthine/uracil permease-like MFS transporter